MKKSLLDRVGPAADSRLRDSHDMRAGSVDQEDIPDNSSALKPGPTSSTIPCLVQLDSEMRTATSFSSLRAPHERLFKCHEEENTFPNIDVSHTGRLFCSDCHRREEEECHHRLDIEITQMDIVRMSRAAAASLSVHSISQLPIVQYDLCIDSDPSMASGEDMVNSFATNRPRADSSWTTVDEMSDIAEGSSLQNCTICTICSKAFVRGDFIRLLPSRRYIHIGCIECCTSASHSEASDPPSPDIQGRNPIDSQTHPMECPGNLDKDWTSSEEIPSWTFVKIGDWLEEDLDETMSPDDSIPPWSFARVGKALSGSQALGSSFALPHTEPLQRLK